MTLRAQIAFARRRFASRAHASPHRSFGAFARRSASPLMLRLALMVAFAFALLMGARALRADQIPSPSPPPKPAPPRTRVTSAPAPSKPRPPLSPEDAALVRELLLVENAELLQHLELFEVPERAEEAHASPPARTQAPLR